MIVSNASLSLLHHCHHKHHCKKTTNVELDSVLRRSHLNKESKLRQYNIGSQVFTRAVSLQYFQGRQSETMSERKLLNFAEKFKAFASMEFHLLSPV